MARPLIGPCNGCALHGAILTAAAIEGVIPLVHSTPGCALRSNGGAAGNGGLATGLRPIAATNLAEKHIVFGGTSRLREQIKNALSILPGGLLTVLTGCPTEMIGDDIAAMVKEVTSQGEAVIDIATAGFSGSAFHGYELFLTHVIERLDVLGAASPDNEKPIVNIFGVVPRHDASWVSDLDEISRLLDGVGLHANLVVGPQCGLDGLKALPQAKASLVLSTWGLAPARTLESRFAVPVIETNGLPVGAEAAKSLLEHLLRGLGFEIGPSAERFLKAELRYEDFALDETLEALATLGRRRFAVVAPSSIAGGLARFLTGTLGWGEAVTVFTDEPPEAAQTTFGAGLSQVLSTSDTVKIAGAIRESGADFLVGTPVAASLAARLGLPFAGQSGPHRFAATVAGWAGSRGTARLLAAIAQAAFAGGLAADGTDRQLAPGE